MQNPTARSVRVTGLRAVYLAGETITAVVDDADALLAEAGVGAAPRIEAGARDAWAGLCLEIPDPAIDRVRLEFTLSSRHGVRTERRLQTVTVRLALPASLPVLGLPVRGPWRVTQGHACGTNHRRGGLAGDFAWDLEAVDASGQPGTPEFRSTHRNAESATFGRVIVAPVSGTIVGAVDGIPDNDGQQDFPRKSLVESVRAPRWVFGNHLVLAAGDGVFVLLGHLQEGSIVVKPGDTVTAGQWIARAGNSGNSVLPHLHVQVMDRADPADPTVSALPAVFRDYREATAPAGSAAAGAVVRRVASGDPPEGATVISAGSADPAP